MYPYGAHGCSLPHPAGLCKSRSMLSLRPWSSVSLGEMQKPTLAADEVSETAFPTLRPQGVKGRGNIISCSGSTVLNETIQGPWNRVTTWYILVTTLTILWVLVHIGKLLLLCKRKEQHVMKTSYFLIFPQKFKGKKIYSLPVFNGSLTQNKHFSKSFKPKPLPTPPHQSDTADCGLGVKSGPPPDFCKWEFYWNTAVSICLHTVCGCFCALRATV